MRARTTGAGATSGERGRSRPPHAGGRRGVGRVLLPEMENVLRVAGAGDGAIAGGGPRGLGRVLVPEIETLLRVAGAGDGDIEEGSPRCERGRLHEGAVTLAWRVSR